MAIRAKDIYDGRKKSRFHLGITITVILAVVVAVVLVFYWLRGYAVYDENGNATIVMPWSQKVATESPAASSDENPAESQPESTTDNQPENTTESQPESTTDGSAPVLPESPVTG